jgi:tRNA pseudouridine38-40 synthase
VDIDRLQQAAGYLIGIHDFVAFGTPPQTKGTTFREVKKAGWKIDGDELTFEVVANAFLYRMVRRLVSYQIEIGRGELAVEQLPALLDGSSRSLVQGLAPPQGLTLEEVSYPEDEM